MTGEEHHDVLIVGGGAAGVNCALECFDIQLDTVLVEASASLGGQLPEILHSVRNVAAGRFADGEALQRALLESAEILGDRVRLSHPVTTADVGARAVEVDGVRLSGRALVVGEGSADRGRPRPADRGGRPPGGWRSGSGAGGRGVRPSHLVQAPWPSRVLLVTPDR